MGRLVACAMKSAKNGDCSRKKNFSHHVDWGLEHGRTYDCSLTLLAGHLLNSPHVDDQTEDSQP